MQCLDYALDRLHAEGGYLIAARSTHWPIAHVMHSRAAPVELTHYSPPADLRQPWYSLFGFAGAVKSGDQSIRLPMSRRGIVLSLAVALALSIWWAARSWINEVRNDDA